MTNMTKYIIAAVAIIFALYGAYSGGYNRGYGNGYDVGYSEGYAERNRLVEHEISDAVAANTKTETKIIYKTVPYAGNDVQVTTTPPTVSVSVNGKKQEIVQHQETADLAVKTETAVAIKIPERRWKIGIGTDGKKMAYMLSAPVKNAVGVWIAGNRQKVMGGVSISF